MVIGIIETYPLWSLLVLSFLITLGLTLSYKKFSNQKEIKASKARIKELQNQIKEEKDQEKVMALQKDMLQINMEHLKHSMKPMMVTFLPLILIFWWLRTTFIPFGVLIDYNWGIPGFCFIFKGICDGAGWFVVYIFSSMFFNITLRKVLKVQ
ncbi:EMC3/TMCO1 family protein [Nanoarchaeota archaeon]